VTSNYPTQEDRGYKYTTHNQKKRVTDLRTNIAMFLAIQHTVPFAVWARRAESQISNRGCSKRNPSEDLHVLLRVHEALDLSCVRFNDI
jgi:hypothetical protein